MEEQRAFLRVADALHVGAGLEDEDDGRTTGTLRKLYQRKKLLPLMFGVSYVRFSAFARRAENPCPLPW